MGAHDVPFGVTVLWPTFGAKPYAKITFQFILRFPELFFKSMGWFTTRLDRENSWGLTCALNVLRPVLVESQTPKLLLCLHFRFQSISLKLMGGEKTIVPGGIFRAP